MAEGQAKKKRKVADAAADKAETLRVLENADRGDSRACCYVAGNLFRGEGGFAKDVDKARKYLELGSEAPDIDGVQCARLCAASYVSKIRKVEMLTYAATCGSQSAMVGLAQFYLRSEVYTPERALFWLLVACGAQKTAVSVVIDTTQNMTERALLEKFCAAWATAGGSKAKFLVTLNAEKCVELKQKCEKMLAAAWAAEEADPTRGPVDDAKVGAVFAAMRHKLAESKRKMETQGGTDTIATRALEHACLVHLMVTTWVGTPAGKQVAALDNGKTPGKLIPWWPDDGTDPFTMSAHELNKVDLSQLQHLVPYYAHAKTLFPNKKEDLVRDWIAYRKNPSDLVR